MDAFARLFEDPQFYKTVMEATAKAMYFKFKNNAELDNVIAYNDEEGSSNMPMAAEDIFI